MKGVKKPLPPTLSMHLLEEAQKFFCYPHRQRRSRLGRKTVELLDVGGRRLIEWRRTFAPTAEKAKDTAFIFEPVLLDELYSRELLRSVTAFVERTRALQTMVFPQPSDAVWFVYLKESAQCFICGLPQASIALARAALEVRLKELCAKHFGNDAAQAAGLDRLIKDYGARLNLSSASLRKADMVRSVANGVLHGAPGDSDEAHKVLESVRELLVALSGR